MNPKLIIFDLDGTLIDAYPAIIKSFNYTMQKLGYKPQDASTIRKSVGWGDEFLLRPFIKEKDLKKALLIYRRHHKDSLVRYSRLYPKVKRVLSYLKDRGYKLAVASNRPTRFSWILIRHLKLKRFFDYVLCADRLRNIKPHPEILNKIMKKFRFMPAQTIYVGDMTIDVQAGKRAKVKTIVVTTGSSTRKEIKRSKPSRIIKSFSSLISLIK
jgi:phosphoglycolate phosphatase